MHRPPVRRRLLQGLALPRPPVLGWVRRPCGRRSSRRRRASSWPCCGWSAQDDELTLDFSARLNLPRAVEDALQRGVPVYFVAEAALYRSRWYWRDERVARVQRSWRVAYQPLTGHLARRPGRLNQSHASLAEALAAMSRSAGWRWRPVADRPGQPALRRVQLPARHQQLPSPMQIGLGGQADWVLASSAR
jgi:hypothetical protein